MYILGINAFHPDSSACLIRDGKLIAAVEEERFLRIKHWAGFPVRAIRYCLSEADICLDDINYIACNRDPLAHLDKKLSFIILQRPSWRLLVHRFANMQQMRGLADCFRVEFNESPRLLKRKIRYIEHHNAHLASAFFVSPFPDATVVSIDGFGDFTSCSVARGNQNKLEQLYRVHYPHSLGVAYTALTQFLGFKKFGDEYKVMGLAAYGKPEYRDQLEQIIALKPRGTFALDLRFFSFPRHGDNMEWDNIEPKLADLFSEELIELLGPSRAPHEEITQRHCDIAASLQVMYEKVFFHILNYAYQLTQVPVLCLSGGCALNSLANGKIFDHTPFKEIYIQPASSDAGGALGAAYYLYHQQCGYQRVFVMRDAYWGPSYAESAIEKSIVVRKEEVYSAGGSIEKVDSDDALCARIARHIADGKVVGWFQGRMEWGPRALGNRSIVVDPRRAEMKDILNARIKRREWFRPFAPSIAVEYVSEYFQKDYPDPFMIKVYPIRPDKRALIPAVAHVDGTGRLQTVSRDENPLYWKLINEFGKITGIPILLNTSFNENEPIVCRPEEALDCFLRTRMDVLALGHYIIERQSSVKNTAL